MNTVLEIRDVKDSSEVCVRGEIFSGSETFICATNAKGSPIGSRINLPHDETQQALLNEVPCMVGGQYLYIYMCEAIGQLDARNLTPTVIVVWRDDNDERYSLSFTR